MGSYCSCSGSFKFNNEVILPKNSLNKKIIDSIPHYSNKEKQDKKSNKIKRYKTYNEAIQKSKKPEKKKIIVQERNSFISSSSCLPQHKIITNSKISPELIKELYEQYKPLDDNIQVEEVQLLVGEGAEYRGEWNKFKGERHGRGILIINKEKIYMGYWKNDKMNGLGKQIYHEINIDNINSDIFKENKSYSYYIGEWKDNYQEGKGKESWPDGTYYEGDYKNGKKWGEGKLHLPDGSIYEGQFKDGEVNGKGKIVYSDKREYDGEWINNKFNGKGVFTWPDGRKYTGEYSNNLKDGYGIFEWPNGRKYRGQWSKGKQNADGEIYDPTKDKWTAGKWNMGKKVKCNV